MRLCGLCVHNNRAQSEPLFLCVYNNRSNCSGRVNYANNAYQKGNGGASSVAMSWLCLQQVRTELAGFSHVPNAEAVVYDQ